MARPLSAPLTLYRIADRRYPVYSGRAAAEVGFRWNPKGVEVIYASLSYAGAMLEKLVHTGIGRVPRYQVVLTASIPGGIRVEEVDTAQHPGWRQIAVSRRIGKQWFDGGETAVLLVPSVVFEGQNALINPTHPDAARFAVSRPREVRWDRRLFLSRS